MKYPVVLHSDDGVKYGVTMPDLPRCFSTGDSIEDALASVIEAIDLYLEGIKLSNYLRPPALPSTSKT